VEVSVGLHFRLSMIMALTEPIGRANTLVQDVWKLSTAMLSTTRSGQQRTGCECIMEFMGLIPH